jgi:hypothetical protein
MISHLEESYRMWCVAECDQETSRMRRPWPALGRSATAKNLRRKIKKYIYKIKNTWYSAQLEPVIKGAEHNKKTHFENR